MRVEVNLRDAPIDRIADLSQRAEHLGYDSVVHAEVRRDPFLASGLTACATQRVQTGTAVAIAFPRSPMVVAYLARNIQELSRGRFALGLGTQVRAHIERRFGCRWEAPSRRLREYVLSLRAIWEAWESGGALEVCGEHYSFGLMTPEFSLGPARWGRVPIDIAGVNARNVRLAGELGDGLRVHSFSTPAYIRDVISPILQDAATRRDLVTPVRILGGCFVATGATEAEVSEAREQVRGRVAFYASTRAYARVLEHHGWQDLGTQLGGRVREQRWHELAELVDDTVLDEFCIAAPYEGLANAVRGRLGGLVDTVTVPMPSDGESRELDLLGAALEAIRRISGPGRETPRSRPSTRS